NFFPSPGVITRLISASGPGVREDSGVYEGWRVPLEYDPMLAKLIVWAASRELAILRMARALDEYFVGGIKSNLNLFRRILRDADFKRGNFHTGTLDRLLAEKSPTLADDAAAQQQALVAALAAGVMAASNGARMAESSSEMNSAQQTARNSAPSAAFDATANKAGWKRTARLEGLRQ
ncbi:MAG: acetyl-CoA carboxylase biotin carboxylase subunit, partial [Steroidobacteraceae bacterium]